MLKVPLQHLLSFGPETFEEKVNISEMCILYLSIDFTTFLSKGIHFIVSLFQLNALISISYKNFPDFLLRAVHQERLQFRYVGDLYEIFELKWTWISESIVHKLSHSISTRLFKMIEKHGRKTHYCTELRNLIYGVLSVVVHNFLCEGFGPFCCGCS